MKTPTGTSGGLETSAATETLSTQTQTMPRSKTTKPAESPLSRLPAGTVTFMLTDVEGSTKRWEAEPDAMKKAMSALDRRHSSGIPLNYSEGVGEAGQSLLGGFAHT